MRMKRLAPVYLLAILLASTGCMLTPENGSTIDSMSGFQLIAAVPDDEPPAESVEVLVADERDATLTSSRWSSVGTFETSGSISHFGINWAFAQPFVPIEPTQWFAVTGGFRAKVRSRWRGRDLWAIDDLACVGAAPELRAVLGCTEGKILEVYAPGFCPSLDCPDPPRLAGDPTGRHCESFLDADGQSVGVCIVDGAGNPLQCGPNFCEIRTATNHLLWSYGCYESASGPYLLAPTGPSTPCAAVGTFRACVSSVGLSADGAGLVGAVCEPPPEPDFDAMVIPGAAR